MPGFFLRLLITALGLWLVVRNDDRFAEQV